MTKYDLITSGLAILMILFFLYRSRTGGPAEEETYFFGKSNFQKLLDTEEKDENKQK